MSDLQNTLERIALALERIATALEGKHQLLKEIPTNDGVATSKMPNQERFLNNISDIEEFLNSKNIRIKTLKEDDEADAVLDKISLYMGSRYELIKDLLANIKRNINSGRPFRIDLKDKPQETIASITQLCSQLHQIAFLSEYKYFKSPKYILYATPNRIPKAINFLTGGWLERYVKVSVIKSILSISEELHYSYLKNPQIILPNGDDFELDVIFQIEDEFFWFEAKTGDYQRYVEKYSKVAKILNLDEEHAYMILTDITKDGAIALRTLFHMNVVRIDSFPECIRGSIEKIHERVKNELSQIKKEMEVEDEEQA